MTDQTGDGADRGERNSLDLDTLAVGDRFRLFNFTRRDDHVAYLWVLRALDRLRGVHQLQAHPDDVAAALAELAAAHDEVPRLDGGLREKLDALAEDGVAHRLKDASRAGPGAGLPEAVPPGHRARRHVQARGPVPPDARRDHPVHRHLPADVPAVQERPA